MSSNPLSIYIESNIVCSQKLLQMFSGGFGGVGFKQFSNLLINHTYLILKFPLSPQTKLVYLYCFIQYEIGRRHRMKIQLSVLHAT